MCGISGWMTVGGAPVNEDILRKMTDAIAHRGPDGDGFFIGNGIGFGHRRLSIIDIAGGAQPMYSDDKNVVLTYNGEIYNYQSLKAELISLGHRFHTKSDTEVLLNSYMQWGADCVSHLRGMFAFAVWDSRNQSLLLARDRLGIKPLYYAFLPAGDIVFGSELKSLLAHPGVTRKLRLDALEDYLMLGYVPDPKTIIDSVGKLEAATTLVVKKGELSGKKHCYWVPGIAGRVSHPSKQDELLDNLADAVEMRMIADVPLGAFLSGGVDSSTIVGLMSKASGDAVQTCAIGSDDPDYDESLYAREVANYFGTNHRQRLISPTDSNLMDVVATLYDEPFADQSALPTYSVCGLARETVKVALSGDGGDELFAGYRRHKFHMIEEKARSRLPLPIRQVMFGPLGKIYPKMDWAPQFLRGKSTFEALARTSAQAYCHSVSKIPDRDRKRLHSAKFRKSLAGYHPDQLFTALTKDVEGCDPLTLIQYLDLKTYLTGDILTKVDRASMAHGLEVRVPLLDHKFVEWSFAVPPSERIKDGIGKHILREAVAELIPANVLNRPKSGFIVPTVAWMREELAGDVKALATNEVLGDSGLFDMRGIGRLADEHVSGLGDHHTTLWSMLMLSKSLNALGLEAVA